MPPPQDNPESQPTIPDQDPHAPALGGMRGLGQNHQCATEVVQNAHDCPMNSLLAVNALTVATAPQTGPASGE